MPNIQAMRDSLKDGDDSVYLRIRITDGSIVDEKNAWVFWDDANETLYSICLPDNVQVDMVYNFDNSGVKMDMANYNRNMKHKSRVFMTYAYTYDSIVGMVALYNDEKVLGLMDQYASSISGDALTQLESMKEKFKNACVKMNDPETYLTGDYSNTNKDYDNSTMY